MGGPVVVTGQGFAIASLVSASAVCAGALGFGLGRFMSRPRSRAAAQGHSEAVLALALEDGLARLKAQQKEMSDRAVASERLNSQIVQNLTAGLLLVDADGGVELLNPAGQRLLRLADTIIGE